MLHLVQKRIEIDVHHQQRQCFVDDIMHIAGRESQCQGKPREDFFLLRPQYVVGIDHSGKVVKSLEALRVQIRRVDGIFFRVFEDFCVFLLGNFKLRGEFVKKLALFGTQVPVLHRNPDDRGEMPFVTSLETAVEQI